MVGTGEGLTIAWIVLLALFSLVATICMLWILRAVGIAILEHFSRGRFPRQPQTLRQRVIAMATGVLVVLAPLALALTLVCR